MQYRVKIEWNREDGSIATAELGQIECGPCHSAADVGLRCWGRIAVDTPRLDGCRFCGDDHVTSPLSRVLPKRVTQELRHLQVSGSCF